MTYWEYKNLYEGKLSIRLERWLRDTLHNREEYQAALNNIKGMARKFGWSYSKKGLDEEDARQECFLKLLQLQKEELKKCLNLVDTKVNKKAKRGEYKVKKNYPYMGTVLKNHLIDVIRHDELDPLWACMGLPGATPEMLSEEADEYYKGEDMPYINIKTYREPRIDEEEKPDYNKKAEELVKKLTRRRRKAPEGEPYINRLMNTPKLLTSRFTVGESIVLRSNISGFVSVGSESFANDVVDRVLLIKHMGEVEKELDKLRESEFSKKLFRKELLNGDRAYIPPDPRKTLETNKAIRGRNIRRLTRDLDTYTNKVKRHGRRLWEIKDKQQAKWIEEYVRDFKIDKNSRKYREWRAYRKAVETGKATAYWPGK